jgi:hypothetical protein
LAGALNCGTGSSFLNALVNTFDKLHIVRGENSGYSGSKYSKQWQWTYGQQQQPLRGLELAVHKGRVENQLRLRIADSASGAKTRADAASAQSSPGFGPLELRAYRLG